MDLDDDVIDEQVDREDRTSRMLDFDREYNQQRPKGRIISGKESKPGAWPWQVNFKHFLNKKIYCLRRSACQQFVKFRWSLAILDFIVLWRTCCCCSLFADDESIVALCLMAVKAVPVLRRKWPSNGLLHANSHAPAELLAHASFLRSLLDDVVVRSWSPSRFRRCCFDNFRKWILCRLRFTAHYAAPCVTISIRTIL